MQNLTAISQTGEGSTGAITIGGAATITGAKVIFGMRCQKILDDTDAYCFPLSVNTNNTAITAFVDVNNHSDLGWTTGAGSAGGGKIPFMRDAAGNLLYVNTYTS